MNDGPCIVDIWGTVDGDVVGTLLMLEKKIPNDTHPLQGHEWYENFKNLPVIGFK